ncbi:MAG: restriction endonuclease subunit S [Fimbriimonas sp.]|nr:restriction endonuclease subunit S [Fimbriimonas sp.]
MVTCFRDGTVTLRKNRRTTGFTEALQEIGYQGIRKGDLVIHAMDAFAGAIGVSDSDGKSTPVYAVCQPSADADAHYFAFILREMSRSEYLLSLAKGIRERSTDFRYSDFASLEVPMPSTDEQAQIVRFIRHLDLRVNRLVKAKRRLIELLNEQKQAIIHRAVTRGLDPTVPLKSSGIEWLGKIPEHWEVKPLKCVFREVDERTTTGDDEILSVSHLTGVTPRSQKNITMFMAESYVGHKKCRPGDLVANTMWMWMGALGVSHVEGILSPSYAVYRPKANAPVHGAFLDMLARTRLYIDEYTKYSTGIRPSRLRLYPEQFLRMPVLLPPLEEQVLICDHLRLATQDIVATIGKANGEIDLIREYRTRLVADVVTGQLDVRHLDLPDLDAQLVGVADLDSFDDPNDEDGGDDEDE